MSRPNVSVENGIKNNLPAGSRMLLGVSGGIDSMVMLDACNHAARELNLHLEVAHIDHGIRSDSHLDASLVREACAMRQISFHLHKLTAPQKGTNIEAWGRKERYSFFKKVRESQKLDWVATAHTANDVAETLLMRLISNKELTSIALKEEQRRLIRPLLTVTRAEIEKYSKTHKIIYREDSTNSDIDILRNKIRLNLIPFLQKEFEPRITDILSERASAIHEDESTLRLVVNGLFNDLKFVENNKVWRRELTAKLQSQPIGVQWRAVRMMLKDKLGFNLSRKRCLEVVDLIVGGRIGVELPGGFRVKTHEGGIIFEKACD